MNLTVLLGMPGPWQIVVLALVVILLFGGKKIPELMKGIGKGIKEFKKGISPDEDEDKKDKKDEKE